MKDPGTGKLAVVTGASSGIGKELARLCLADGFDLIVVSEEAEIHQAASELDSSGTRVTALQSDLSTIEGVDRLLAVVAERQVDALLANAGHGLDARSSTRISPTSST